MSVDVRAFRTTLYTAARDSGFTVEEPPPDKAEIYHTLVRSLVSFRDEQWSLLLNIHYPYVAFAAPSPDAHDFNFKFRDCDALAVNLFGYTVLSADFLNSPVTEDAIALLGESEKHELRYWVPKHSGMWCLTSGIRHRSPNMVFTLGPSAHLGSLATGLGLGTISLTSGIARFVQGGVVKTFR